MMKPIVVAGPCAAETEQQVLDTAAGIAQCRLAHAQYLYIYRAGIWKPRTSPDTFQGIGGAGLVWLQHVQQRYDLPVATEVATPEQVRLAMEAGIDYLWIGARTSANPMAVQAIADSIKAFSQHLSPTSIKGILLKNPVNEDAALWLGNIERLEQTGVTVVAVHRGCNHHPCWQMAHTLRQQCPNLPMVLDPSHMVGKASAVLELCTKAHRLNYQGWMIETHITPASALSDAAQQITPADLANVLEHIEQAPNACQADVELDWLRSMIDEVDDDLWRNISRRMDICRQIGQWKKTRQMPIVQPSRYQQMLQKRKEWGRIEGIDEQAIEQIMDAIHKESVRIQS